MAWGEPPFVDCSPCDGLLTANNSHLPPMRNLPASGRLAV